MAEGNWQCGMCAAYNEASKPACMVCDTFRVLGASGAAPDGGDLLASTQSMFEAQREGPATAPSPAGTDDLPRVRVMEPPPVRPGSARPGSARPGTERSGTEQPATAWSVTSMRGPEPGKEQRERRERQAGIDTEPVPVVTEPLLTGPGVPVTEPLTVVSGRDRSTAGEGSTPGRTSRSSGSGDAAPWESGHRSTGRWSLPRWPQGTVRALALAVVGATVLVLVWVLPGDEGGGAGPAEGERERDACPERIAALLPGAGPGPLVESFETERHRIVLCANGAGELYYFGEFLDDSGEVMLVPAARTEEGYVADAGQTRYEIGGGVVVITGGDGAEIARLPLDPVPAPE